jgi:hypothetical protein
MKKCPQCGTQYSDVTLSFCLQDGTPLIVAPQADTPTVVLGDTETAIPRRDAIRVPIDDPNSGGWDKSQVTHVAQPPEKKSSKTALAVLLTIIGMLLLFGIIGIAAILFWPRPSPESARNSNNTNVVIPNNNSATPSSTVSPIKTAQINPASTPRPSPATTFASPASSSYPPTTRLKFGRGGYSTSFSGDINPGDSRSLVLACRSGQTLTANLSGSSCVSIRGSGTSFRTTTSSGDNYVTVVSTCSTTARFTITISVI